MEPQNKKSEIYRLWDLSAGNHWQADDQLMLFACLTNADPKTAHLLDRRWKPDSEFTGEIPPSYQQAATLLYQIVSGSDELIGLAATRICGAIEAYLRPLMVAEELEAFKKANPLKDDYIPGFVDAKDAMKRVTDAKLFDATQRFGLVPNNRSWGLLYAVEVVKTALGGIELTHQSLQQLWFALQRHTKDVAKGCECSASRSIQACICKIANTNQWEIHYPIDFGILEEFSFTSEERT